MSPTLLVFAAICVFAGGIVVGYIEGWAHGTAKGYSVGWSAAFTEVRRIIARITP